MKVEKKDMSDKQKYERTQTSGTVRDGLSTIWPFSPDYN